MQPLQLNLQLGLELLETLSIDTSRPPVRSHLLPGERHVRPLVHLVHQRVDLPLARWIEPVRQSPRSIASGSFTKGTILHHRPYSSRFLTPPTALARRLPQPTRLPIARSRWFPTACGTTRRSDCSRGVVPHFASSAYRVPYLSASREPPEPSWGHAQIFRTVPPAHTLVRWVDENAFAPIVRARPCPTFGRPVRHGDGSPRLRPGTSPHALRIPPRGGHPALRVSSDRTQT